MGSGDKDKRAKTLVFAGKILENIFVFFSDTIMWGWGESLVSTVHTARALGT